ncbi:MAG: BTAD domain-containing putative transcriptional regulator, partial [Stackebrandtia sp.]
MEFRILGALEVMRDGSPLAIRGRIAPRLLAVLALEAGHAVPVPTLVQALWDEAPATARRQVQNTVSTLRGVLGDGIVAAADDGYRLAVPSEAVDAGRFTAAVARARRLRQAGEPEAALTLLREGLSLWRGRALAGLSGRLLTGGARRLDEAGLTALADRFDLELELGHRVGTGELRQLLTEHPYRQRFAAQLMLALYREGRTPEALEVHVAMRDRLGSELGSEPGPVLRERHAAILREDPELDAKPTARLEPIEPGFAPAQLPADLAGFTGRRVQLGALDSLTAGTGDAAALNTITGYGGTGKTALAVHWAHRNKDRFPDGQLYVNLRGFDDDEPLTPQQALARLLPALGQPSDRIPSDLEAASQLYRSLLAERRILVLLDNARDAAQVRPLLPGGAENVTLVTSRHRLTELAVFHNAKPVVVEALDESDASALLHKLVPESRLEDEPEAAARLVQLCAGLPLALRIVGANLAGRRHSSVAAFTAEHEGPNRLGLLAVDDDPHATVATAFERSFSKLDSRTRELFLRLGLIPGDDLPEDLARVVGGATAAEVRKLLGRLEGSHLIERHRPNRFRFHDLVRLYAKQRAESTLDEWDLAALKATVIDWYATTFNHSDGDDPSNVIAAFRAWPQHRQAWRLARMLPAFSKFGHNLAELRPHVETGLAMAKAAGDQEALCQMYDALAQIHVTAGNELTALTYGRKAVAISRRLPNGDANGRLRSELGALLLYNSYYDESVEMSREALDISTAENDSARMIQNLIFLGAALRSSGRFDEAETHFDHARRLADECGPDEPRRVTARFKLARLYNDMDRLELAWEQITWIESWWRRTGTAYIRNGVLWLRGQLNRRFGDYEAAHRDLSECWESSNRTGNAAWARHARLAQIELCCAQGDYRQGLVYADELAESGADSFERDDRAQWAILRAKVHVGLERYRSAVASAEQARTVFTITKCPLRLAHCLAVLADAKDALEEPEAAEQHRTEAQQIFARLGLK